MWKAIICGGIVGVVTAIAAKKMYASATEVYKAASDAMDKELAATAKEVK